MIYVQVCVAQICCCSDKDGSSVQICFFVQSVCCSDFLFVFFLLFRCLVVVQICFVVCSRVFIMFRFVFAVCVQHWLLFIFPVQILCCSDLFLFRCFVVQNRFCCSDVFLLFRIDLSVQIRC